ncbi:hypothetical protein TrispH2_011918 [Trichoplax sp. H2]|nr:hypothetical protein TrispH2_011918 [Trichoplax sp. H2]|eukprot:RDD36172.1 hypothetical protein TrispH2_011918 [Trichoplax sp. H2]
MNSHLSNCIINRIDQLREKELSKRGCFDIPYEIIGETVKVDVPYVLHELSQDYIKKFEELHKNNLLITSTSKAYIAIKYWFEDDDIYVAFNSFSEKLDALRAPTKAALHQARNSLVDTNNEFRNERYRMIPQTCLDKLYESEIAVYQDRHKFISLTILAIISNIANIFCSLLNGFHKLMITAALTLFWCFFIPSSNNDITQNIVNSHIKCCDNRKDCNVNNSNINFDNYQQEQNLETIV